MPTVRVTDDTFEAQVLRATKPVIVDFWAPWCQPCRVIAPILEELSEELANVLTIAKLDTDSNPKVSGAMRIQSIPTMVLFENGRPTQAIQGVMPKAELKAQIESWFPNLGPPVITPDELAHRLKAGERIAIFDLRREQDFTRSHIARAENVTAENLPTALAQMQPATIPVLVCRTGEDSTALATKLKNEGVQIVALQKGLLAWEGSGHPTYSTAEERAEANH